MRDRLAAFRVRGGVESTPSRGTADRIAKGSRAWGPFVLSCRPTVQGNGRPERQRVLPGRLAKGSGAYRPGPFVRYSARANRRALSPPRLLGCETQRPPGFHVEGSLLFSVLGGNSCPSSTRYNATASRMVSGLRVS